MRKNDDADMPVANITPFGLRLQPGLKRRVDEAAKANGRSINAEIAARLDASFAGTEKEGDDLGQRVKALERELETVQKQMRWLENEWGQRPK